MNKPNDFDENGRPLRVLHVLEATGGGTMRYMENIAEAMQGLEVACGFAYGVSRADAKLIPFLERVEKRGWKLYPIDMRREISTLKDFAALLQLRKAIKAFAPDIVQCHSSKAGALGRMASTGLTPRPERVYSPHAVAAPLGSKYLILERLLARLTDRFIAVSDSERRQLIELGLASEGNVDVVYPSIDFGHFIPFEKQSARDALNLGNGPIVVTIGRMTEQKAPGTFLEIMKRLVVTHPNVTGLWVGSGGGAEEFRASVGAAGLKDRIVVVPWVNDVRTYIAAADVVLSTSKFESFGYVSAEALAMQRPVVASDVTGTCDILRGELNRWLYSLGDFDKAAALLGELLSNADQADAVGTAGRKLMLQIFNTRRMREALGDTYISLLDQTDSLLPASQRRRVALTRPATQRPTKDVAA